MLSRSLLTSSGQTGRRLPLSSATTAIRRASQAFLDVVLDSERPLRDRLIPIFLLAIVSTLPLVVVALGTGLLFAIWLVTGYLLAGYLWVNMAAKRADRSHYWRAWLVVAVGIITVTLALHASATAVVSAVVAVGAVAMVVAGVRLHLPTHALLWYVLAGSLGIAVAGQIGATVGLLRNDVIPVAASLVSLAGIIPLPVITWLLLHRRVGGSSRTSLLDTATVTLSLGLLAWVILIAPPVADSASTRLEQAAVLGWPVVMLAVLVVAIRSLLARWPQPSAARNLVGGSLFLLISAVAVTSWRATNATDPAGYPGLSIIWLLALAGLGGAALHPSMLQLAEPVHEHATEFDWQRGLLLTLSLLMAPVALIVQHRSDESLTVEVIAGGSALLVVLFAARAFGLQRARGQSRASDRYLRLAAADLVISDNRQAIVQIAIDAAHKITGTRATTALYLADGPPGEFMLQTETGARTPRVIRERELPQTVRRVLAAGTTAWLSVADVDAARVPLGIDPAAVVAAIAPVGSDPGLDGMLVSAGNRLDLDTARCLETLAALVALALDRQSLIDEGSYAASRTAVQAHAADGTTFTFIDVDPVGERVEPTRSAVTSASIGEALRDALARNSLRERLQPRFDLVSGRVASIQLSLAWDSPHGGQIPHTALAAIATEHGLSQPFRQTLLLTGCHRAVDLEGRYPGRAIEVVIPLSAVDLSQPGLSSDVEQALSTTGCNAARIVLQCPAPGLLEFAPVIVPELGDLAAIGVQIAVTESGAAWSEFEHLESLPLSTIELEPALIQQIDSDERAAAIAAHLIARAHHVGARVVAHGIDQRQHWISLRKLHGDIGQGDLFSPPLDVDALDTLLGRSQQRATAA